MSIPAVGAAPWADVGFQQTYYAPIGANRAPRTIVNGTIAYGGAAPVSPLMPTLIQDCLGTLRVQLDTSGNGGICIYRFVQLASGSANLVAGNIAMMSTISSVTSLTTVDSRIAQSARNMPAGVAVAAFTAGNVDWLQIWGPHPGVTTDGSTFAIGDVLEMYSTDTQATVVAAGTGATYTKIGKAMKTVTASPCPAFITML